MSFQRLQNGLILILLRQLQQQGVLQSVAIITKGYPHRMPYAELHTRYAGLLRRLSAATMSGASGGHWRRTNPALSVRPTACKSAFVRGRAPHEGGHS